MTSPTPDRTVVVAWRSEGARGYLMLGLLLFTLPMTGCSALIAHSYMADAANRGCEWNALAAPRTQPEVHAALGKPAQAFVCADGRRLDTYRLPKKMDVCIFIQGGTQWGTPARWGGRPLTRSV